MKISIITPNYNYAHFLNELLDSVVQQNYLHWEHIIVDDGSTDGSVSIIRSYVDRYPQNFKCVVQENAGQSMALNRALSMVTGELIMWINSDDSFCPHAFSAIVKEFEKDPNLDVLFGDIQFMDMKGRNMFLHRNQPFRYVEAAALGFTMYVSSNAVVWKSELMKSLDGFQPDFKCNMDGEFFSRLFHSAKYQYAPIAIANFRKQPFSKAAENDERWTSLMNHEINVELTNSRVQLRKDKGEFFNLLFPLLKRWYRIKRGVYRKWTGRDRSKKRGLMEYYKSENS